MHVWRNSNFREGKSRNNILVRSWHWATDNGDIYSSSSELFSIFYRYRDLGSISAQVTGKATACHSVLIDPCSAVVECCVKLRSNWHSSSCKSYLASLDSRKHEVWISVVKAVLWERKFCSHFVHSEKMGCLFCAAALAKEKFDHWEQRGTMHPHSGGQQVFSFREWKIYKFSFEGISSFKRIKYHGTHSVWGQCMGELDVQLKGHKTSNHRQGANFHADEHCREVYQKILQRSRQCHFDRSCSEGK